MFAPLKTVEHEIQQALNATTFMSSKQSYGTSLGRRCINFIAEDWIQLARDRV